MENDSLKNKILQQFKGFMEEKEVLRKKEVSNLKELFHVEKKSQLSFANSYSPSSGDEAVVQSLNKGGENRISKNTVFSVTPSPSVVKNSQSSVKEERNLSPEVFPRIFSLADLVKKNIDESRGAKRVFINEILCVRDVNVFSLTGWALAVAHPIYVPFSGSLSTVVLFLLVF